MAMLIILSMDEEMIMTPKEKANFKGVIQDRLHFWTRPFQLNSKPPVQLWSDIVVG